MAAGEVLLRGEEKIDHEFDHLARREVFPGLFVRLFRPNPDEFLEDIAHLDGVHAGGREVNGGEPIDHEVEKVFLGHPGDLRAEIEPLHDGPDIGGKAVDVAVEVGGKLVGVVQQARLVQLGQVVKGVPGN